MTKNIIMVVGETAIGAIQSMKVHEDKDKDGYTTNVTIDATRIRFDKKRIKEAFEKGFLTAANQVYPFDIIVMEDATFKYTSMEDQAFKECWALSNLRPLSSKQNFMDGVKRIRHQ